MSISRMLFPTHVGLCTLFVMAFVVAGCDEYTGDADLDQEADDMTIVVEADKSRILEEESALNKKREAVDGERKRLINERQEVERRLSTLSKKDRKARERLEAEQRRLDQEETRVRQRAQLFESERSKLDREKSRLLERISAMTQRNVGGFTVAQREEIVARREKVVAKREVALATREEKIATRERQVTKTLTDLTGVFETLKAGAGKNTVVHATGTANRGQAQRAQQQLKNKMDLKGILIDDLPPTARSAHAKGLASLSAKEFGIAVASFKAMLDSVNAISINQGFVAAKMHRLNKAVTRQTLAPKKKNRVQSLLGELSDAYSDGRYDRANKKANQIATVLRGK